MPRSISSSVLVPEVHTLHRGRVDRLRRLAYLLDNSIPIPGTGFRIGLDALIGLVPGVGDLVGGAFALFIVLEAARMGVPRALLLRMGSNLALDVLVGGIPLLGDLFDAGFKANVRNLALLERHVDRPAESRRRNRRFVFVVAGLIGLCAAAAVALAVAMINLLLSRPVL